MTKQTVALHTQRIETATANGDLIANPPEFVIQGVTNLYVIDRKLLQRNLINRYASPKAASDSFIFRTFYKFLHCVIDHMTWT
jgi:hypothetical protein